MNALEFCLANSKERSNNEVVAEAEKSIESNKILNEFEEPINKELIESKEISNESEEFSNKEEVKRKIRRKLNIIETWDYKSTTRSIDKTKRNFYKNLLIQESKNFMTDAQIIYKIYDFLNVEHNRMDLLYCNGILREFSLEHTNYHTIHNDKDYFVNNNVISAIIHILNENGKDLIWLANHMSTDKNYDSSIRGSIVLHNSVLRFEENFYGNNILRTNTSLIRYKIGNIINGYEISDISKVKLDCYMERLNYFLLSNNSRFIAFISSKGKIINSHILRTYDSLVEEGIYKNTDSITYLLEDMFTEYNMNLKWFFKELNGLDYLTNKNMFSNINIMDDIDIFCEEYKGCLEMVKLKPNNCELSEIYKNEILFKNKRISKNVLDKREYFYKIVLDMINIISDLDENRIKLEIQLNKDNNIESLLISHTDRNIHELYRDLDEAYLKAVDILRGYKYNLKDIVFIMLEYDIFGVLFNIRVYKDYMRDIFVNKYNEYAKLYKVEELNGLGINEDMELLGSINNIEPYIEINMQNESKSNNTVLKGLGFGD